MGAGMNTISDEGLRKAMLSSILDQDKRREQILIEQLRDRNAQITRIQREVKRLMTDLLVVQRQQAAIADALALEFGQ